MKEEYFKQVIFEISNLCSILNEKESNDSDKIAISNLSDFDIEEYYSNRGDLTNYLIELSDTTLNTVCALMNFGSDYNHRVLPINLTKVFNKFYLTYWFDKNQHEDKEIIVDYLISKSNVLPKYLNRAIHILFYLKDSNLNLNHNCGGSLYLDDGITKIDYNLYELNLNCMKCNQSVTKVVDEHYLNNSI